MINKNVYRSKGAMVILFIPLLIINMIFTGNYEYAFMTRIVCLSISMLILIISNISIIDRDLGVLKYIGVGYLYIVILRFLDLEKMWVSGEVEISLAFIHIIAYIELFNILISTIFNNRKMKVVYQHLINLINIIFIYLLVNYNKMFLNNSITNLVNFSFVMSTVLFGLIIYIFIKLKLNHKKLIIFSSLIYITVILSFLGSLYNMNFFIAIGILKIISYFIIYEFVENNILALKYLKAYKILKDFKDRKILLNKRLNQRNNELSDLNTLIEKTEKKYYKIITALSTSLIVFENDMSTYSNIRDLNVLDKVVIKDDFDNNYKNTLSAVVKKYCDIEYENNIDDFKLLKDFKINNGENKKMEISLVTIHHDKRILLINDVTKIIKQREELINLEKNIKAEILKEEFHSNISHELRTPINVIYSALQLKEFLIKEEKYDRITDNNNVIRQNCLRLIRTIDNFIDSNRLSDNKIDYHKKIHNIVDIIENILIATRKYIRNRDIEILFEPQYEEIYFQCEKNYIERIMLNILSNSVKYGKDNARIIVLIEVENEKIKITVSNNNDAIPEEQYYQVFEKFTKVNNSLNRATEGSGLGLFVTRGLVELHGGIIKLLSKEGRGNNFIIELPYNDSINNINYKESVLYDEIEFKAANEDYLNLVRDFEINDLKKKVEIEFSDIYF